MDHPHTNRLVHEVSLYLRQHAHNPVDWAPWGPEALERARRQDKPILVSIGYSACHWCHVMERESFEDPEVAAIMNAHFVCIKVDREERPDVDAMYMDALVAMTGSGGWPLNCFLMPDGRPFFGGTYYPPSPRYGRPSWREICERVADFYTHRREQLDSSADQLVAHLGRATGEPADAVPPPEVFEASVARFVRRVDRTWGGFGAPPKFPNVGNLELLLTVSARDDSPRGVEALELATLTADKMAAGGIFDHLGGGFARYSTDLRWLVPHFEKMLYDNALLPRLYLELHRQTGAARHAELARSVLDYLERELLAPEGGFYAAQDADSEGEEGRFFLWTHAEVTALLGPDRAPLFCDAYDVTEAGNHEGKNILHRPVPLEALAQRHGLSVEALRDLLAEGRATLFEARERRVKPARDDKRIAAWNGLALLAFARAAMVLGEQGRAAVAERCADFVRDTLWDGAALRRIHALQADGTPVVKIDGFVEDYAALAHGLLELYTATGRAADLALAAALADVILARFFDPATGDLYLTPADAAELPMRKRVDQDGATPSAVGESVAALLRLSALTGRADYAEAAASMLRRCAALITDLPLAVPSLLVGLDLFHRGVVNVVVVGDPAEPATAALAAAARASRPPTSNVVVVDPVTAPSPLLDPELLAGRLSPAAPRAFPCRGFACDAPLSDPAALAAHLRRL